MILVRLLSLAPLLSATASAHDSGSPQRPNVVLVIADDQGWADYGFMGHPDIRTPNLDRLARRSLVFERGYVTSPLCRPSLASIATGLHAHQHGVVANDVDPERRAESDAPVTRAFRRLPSLVRALTDAGYLTHQSGKWWEGSYADGGFTHGMTHGDPDRGGRHGDAGLRIGRAGLRPVTDFVDHAVAEERPFFLWYAPFLPHTPHDPPEELLREYQAPGRPENVARYYAMCAWFDRTCGELLDHLERRGVLDDTLVVYVCDNGWAPVDRAAENPPGWWPDFAPRSKGSPFEGGIRTPILLSWPGHVEPARADELACSVDLMPTILRACGVAAPAGLAGVDLLDEDARTRRDAIFGASYSIHNMVPGDPAATRQYRWCIAGDWKLLLRDDGADTTRYRTVHEWDRVPARLWNLRADPREREDVLSRHPDVAERLRARIEAWLPTPATGPDDGGPDAGGPDDAAFALPADLRTPAERAPLVGELRRLMLEGVQRTAPRHEGHADLETVFDGSYDHHSCVIAHWALLVLARMEGDAALEANVLARLDRGRALAAELALLDSARDRLFHPYDEAWLLMLAAELARCEGVDAGEVERVRRALERRLLDHLRKAPFPDNSGRLVGRGAFSGTYGSWLFAYLLLGWNEPVTEGMGDALQYLHSERIEPVREALLAQTKVHPHEFLSVQALLALVDRTRGWESPYTVPGWSTLPDSVERNTVHVVGLELSRLWPLAADAHAGDEAAAAAHDARLLEILRRPDLWREDFMLVAHWVPQFVFLGLWLREGRP